jgi:hypothetical protein
VIFVLAALLALPRAGRAGVGQEAAKGTGKQEPAQTPAPVQASADDDSPLTGLTSRLILASAGISVADGDKPRREPLYMREIYDDAAKQLRASGITVLIPKFPIDTGQPILDLSIYAQRRAGDPYFGYVAVGRVYTMGPFPGGNRSPAHGVAMVLLWQYRAGGIFKPDDLTRPRRAVSEVVDRFIAAYQKANPKR